MNQATGGGGVIELVHSKENSKLKAGQWRPTSFLITNTMPGQYDAARQGTFLLYDYFCGTIYVI